MRSRPIAFVDEPVEAEDDDRPRLEGGAFGRDPDWKIGNMTRDDVERRRNLNRPSPCSQKRQEFEGIGKSAVDEVASVFGVYGWIGGLTRLFIPSDSLLCRCKDFATSTEEILVQTPPDV